MKEKLSAGRIFFGTISLTGLVFLGMIFLIDPNLHSAIETFMGSYQGSIRTGVLFALMAIQLTGVLLSAALLFWSIKKPSKFQFWISAVEQTFQHSKNLVLLSTAVFCGISTAGYYSLSANGQHDPLHVLFLGVSRPFWIWMILVLLSFLFVGLFISGKFSYLGKRDFVIPISIFLFLVLLGSGLLFFDYGFPGSHGPANNFDLTGSPILGYQVGISLILMLILLMAGHFFRVASLEDNRRIELLIDLAIVIILFLGAFFLWSSTPIQAHSFIDSPRPPNYEFYPDSDALLYDRTALSLLTKGKLQSFLGSFEKDVGLRPGLTVFLAGLHSFAGMGYQDIIPWQLLIFSLLPAAFYVLVSLATNRPAGFLAAVLFTLRDYNGQVVGNIDAGVHSKLLKSELPAILGMLVFLILYISWKRSEDKNVLLPLVGGGILGWTVLIRIEVILLIPAAALVTLLGRSKKMGELFKDGAFLILGLILVVSPWVMRNWFRTGDLYINRPGNRIYFIRQSLEELGQLEPDFNFPAALPQSDQDKAVFHSPGKQSLSTNSTIRRVSSTNPSDTREIIFSREGQNEYVEVSLLDHLGNNFLQSLVYLPSNPLFLNLDYQSKLLIGKVDRYYGGILYSPRSYMRSLPYWSTKWNGNISPVSVVPVLINLLVISYGMFLVVKWDWETFLILVIIYLGFVSVYSIVQRSGGRSLQLSDWVVLVFYSVGLSQIMLRVLGMVFEKQCLSAISIHRSTSVQIGRNEQKRVTAVVFTAILLLFVGLIPPLGELVLTRQYIETTDNSQRIINEDDLNSIKFEEKRILKDLLTSDIEVIRGRAYYPRQFFAGEKLSTMKPEITGPIDRINQDRFEFFMVGEINYWVVLHRDQTPERFPHGTSVLVLGCPQKQNLNALGVIKLDENRQIVKIYWRDGDLDNFDSCPFPVEPE